MDRRRPHLLLLDPQTAKISDAAPVVVCRLQKPKVPQVVINNRLAGAALSAATGLSQPGITKPKLPPAKGLAMDVAMPKAVAQAVTPPVQSSVARAAGPSAGSQSRSSRQSGEEAAENVPAPATSGGLRSDHAMAEDAGLSFI